MWDFIFDSIRLLDASSTGIANFHIAFLISLMPYAGIFPDISDYEEGDCFDMRSATFTPIRPVHNDFLQGNDAKGVTLFCRISYYNSRHFRLRPEERMYALRRILRYYSIHFPGVGQLRSIDVLHEIFSS